MYAICTCIEHSTGLCLKSTLLALTGATNLVSMNRFITIFYLLTCFYMLATLKLDAAVETSYSAVPQSTPKATAGVGVAIGQGIAFSGFISPRADYLYAQAHVFIDFEGDYVVNVDGVYPLTKLLGASRFWDIYAGLGFVVGDSQSFGWEWSEDRDTDGDLYFGARVPIGALFYIPRTPLQVGAEIAPSYLVTPVRLGFLSGALIGRVVFEF